jgi:RHS repeat-associated protein
MTITISGSGWSLVREYEGSQSVVNREQSEYGPGWWLENQDKLYLQGGGAQAGAMLVEGDGTVRWFKWNGTDFDRAQGDSSYSTLTVESNGYRLTDKWGNYRKFDSGGRIVSIHSLEDSSHPDWVFQYETSGLGRLVKMIDHAEREVQFQWPQNAGRMVCVFQPGPMPVYPALTTRVSAIDPETGEFYVEVGNLEGPGLPGNEPFHGPVTRYRYGSFGCAVVELPSLDPEDGPQAKRTYDFDSFGLLSAIHFHNLGSSGTETHTIELSPMLKQGLRALPSSNAPLHFVANDQAQYIDEREKVWSFATDRFGQISRWVTPLNAVTNYDYDQSNGELYRYIGPDPDGTGPQSAPMVYFGYSGLGNLVIEKTIGDSNTPTSEREWTYHSTLNLPLTATDELGKTEEMTYDVPTGNMLSYTDRQGHTWEYVYDEQYVSVGVSEHGRLRMIISPDPDGSGGNQEPVITEFQYFSDTGSPGGINYRLVHAVVNADQSVRTFQFGDWDSLFSETDEENLTMVYLRDPLNRVIEIKKGIGPYTQYYAVQWQYEYGKNGKIISQKDALENETKFTYDARYRLLTQTLPDPDDEGWLPSPVYTWKYNPTGQVIQATNPAYATGYKDVYEFDDAGRMVKHIGPLDSFYSNGQETIYQYDLLDRLIRTKDPSGRVERWKYDIRDRLVEYFPSDPDDGGSLTGPSVNYYYDDASRLIAVRDELFRQTDYQYTDNGWLFKAILPDPDLTGPQARSNWQFSFDALGRRTEIEDPLDRETHFTYDNRHRIASVTTPDPDGNGSLTSQLYEYEYDLVGNLEKILLPLNREIVYTYDPFHRLESAQPPLEGGSGISWEYQYDAVNNITKQTARKIGASGEDNAETEFEYDHLYRLTKVIQAWPDGPNGQQPRPELQWVYNEHGLLSSTVDALNRSTVYGYDFGGRMNSMTLPGQPSGYSYEFDALDRLTKVVTPDPDDTGSLTPTETSYVYDLRSRLAQVISNVTSSVNSTTTYRWNDANELTGLRDTLGNLTQWSFDRLGRRVLETNSLGHSRANSYDLASNLTRTTDRNGRIVKYSFDDLNRMTSEQWYSHSSVPTVTVQTLTQGGSSTNEVQKITVAGMSSTNSGTFTLGFNGYTTKAIAYDADANTVRDALTEAIPYYNSSNLSVSLNVLQNGNREYTVTFTGDNGNQDQPTIQGWGRFDSDPSTALKTIGFAFDQAGRLASTTDWNASMQAISNYEYEYDVRNQLRFETATIAGLTPQVKLERTYDRMGNRKMLRAELVNGSTITKDFQNDYKFDLLNRLTQIKQTTQGSGTGYHFVQDKRIDLTYNKLGQFTSINRMESLTTSDDNLETVYSYDLSNRLSVLSHRRDGGNHVLSNYEFDYDAMNRITSIDHTAGTGGYADGFSVFTYDKASQLIGADHAPARPDENYQFDANGNRTGGAYQNEANNQTTYDGTYQYQFDKEGNRIKRIHGEPWSEEDVPFDIYVYDHRNRLVQVKKYQSEIGRYYDFVNYTYDSFNRMIKRQSGTHDTQSGLNTQTRDQYFAGYDGINPTLELETSATTSAPAATESSLKHRYLWGPVVDQLLADEQYTGTNTPATTAGNTLWALADHLGTIRDIADFDTSNDPAEFTIVNHRVFDSFGRLTSETNSSVDLCFAYTGKFMDDSTGLSHHWNRWYDPKLGKWISEDPIGFAGGDANLSRYVGNDSLNFVDIEGNRKYSAKYLLFYIDDEYRYAWYSLCGMMERAERCIFGVPIDISGEQERKARATIGENIARPDGGQIDIHQYNQSYAGTAMQRGTIEGLATAQLEFYGAVSPTPLVGSIGRQSGYKILGVEDYLPPLSKLDNGIAASKALRRVSSVPHTYVNPGHHDPKIPNTYIKGRSKIPDNHIELFGNSVPIQAGDKILRFAREGKGKNAVYHRFDDSVSGEYHWNGSSNGKLPNGEPRPLEDRYWKPYQKEIDRLVDEKN